MYNRNIFSTNIRFEFGIDFDAIVLLSNVGATIFIMHSSKICGLLSVLMVIATVREGAAKKVNIQLFYCEKIVAILSFFSDFATNFMIDYND